MVARNLIETILRRFDAYYHRCRFYLDHTRPNKPLFHTRTPQIRQLSPVTLAISGARDSIYQSRFQCNNLKATNFETECAFKHLKKTTKYFSGGHEADVTFENVKIIFVKFKITFTWQ